MFASNIVTKADATVSCSFFVESQLAQLLNKNRNRTSLSRCVFSFRIDAQPLSYCMKTLLEKGLNK